ncbi:serine/threonine-protein kinase [Actinomadura sp. J1-007]|uniref:serine/threonine-protein kinase n=1 Tax=Actinomadura sp. J1-007 TaxID=2661913 RepID=UPI0019D620C8|nr:serine/threonine-protein kinase [Actinomadura sp. J1-007]
MAEDLGRVLAGRYRLAELLGQGGMGAVWRAHDAELDREVAVKEVRLPDGLDQAQRASWIARLDREARAAARLTHPGIITVHDRITGEDGRPWIVMEFVRGRSLDDLLRAEGPLPARRVAELGLQVLDALRATHRAGITHRDIKPANVLLDGDRAILTDFGVAAVEGDATLTRSGALLGTPAFMSPSRSAGRRRRPRPTCGRSARPCTGPSRAAGRSRAGTRARSSSPSRRSRRCPCPRPVRSNPRSPACCARTPPNA